MHTTALFSALLGAGLGCAHALIIPITRRSSPHSTTVHLSSASKNTPSGDDPFSFQGIDDLFYTGLIYASGLPFTVHLDTGSSDLWLDTQNAQLKKFTDTGVIGTITYLDTTSATGNIVLTNVMWGEFSVPQQAMINAPGSNATDGVVQGLLGIGPPLLSSVNDTLTSSGSQYDGSTFLDNVFGLYPDEPNFMTFLLSRNEFGVSDGGVFTIGDVEQNHSSITQTPELKVVAPDSWSLFMDGVIINGKQLTGGSQDDVVVPGGVPNGKTVSLLDTGTALGLAPPAYVDAMYGHIPGATFDGVDTYHVPCDSKVNISMVFGSYVYPMHPIDSIYLNALLDDGTVDCIGTFSYSNNTGGDFILGDAFMRNTYSLFDFGSWATVEHTDPFMQL